MMKHCFAAILLSCSLLPLAFAQTGKLTAKTATTEPPAELAEPIRKLLDAGSIQVNDGDGKSVAEYWFRKAIPVDATAEQVKNGVTYREAKSTEIFGAVRFDQDSRDYRKQKVKAGVYTLRLGFQPADGDHQGSSDFTEFLLAIAAENDRSPELLDSKALHEASQKSIKTGHPGVFMLFPASKPGASPEIQAKPRNHQVLATKIDALVDGKVAGAPLGVTLTVVGSAE
ncbi:MAG: hypothetical protein K2X38_16420 [Gemmataceae bacterium]|nr:hypothetical protein [Gemmataceae bacterium]